MNKNNYQNLLDNLYEGIFYVDLNKTIKYWSSGAERITGYSSDEVLGKHCHDNIINHINKNSTYNKNRQHCFSHL